MRATDDLTIPGAFLRAADQFGASPALVDSHRTITYAALRERALRAGAVFARHGVCKGDRVAICLPNSVTWVEAALGATCIGAVVVPISTRLKAQEAAYILRKSRASALVAAGRFLGVDYLAMLDGIDLPDLDLRLGADIGEGGSNEWNDAIASISDDALPEVLSSARAVRGDDLCEVIFTSGTTGFPKGAMLRHAQVVRTYSFYADRVGIREGDRYYIIAPMFHSFGFKAGVIASILKGATMYPVRTFDAATTLQAIETDRISVMGGPPTIFSSLIEANLTAGRDLSSLRSIVTGASMVSPALIRALQQDVGVEHVFNAYGLTESCALVTLTSPDDEVERIATTAGRVIDGVEMRCVDADGAPVPAGEPGEIEVRGYNVMAGYFEEADETASVMRPDGWLRTGDVGIVDEAGYLRVTDRMKDMFIVGGFNCYPAEIEKMILEHPAVREVAVVGVPDDRLGEVAKAYVVVSDAAAFDSSVFIDWCRRNMANYKVPRFVEVTPTLPRNAMGKVQKFLLRPKNS